MNSMDKAALRIAGMRTILELVAPQATAAERESVSMQGVAEGCRMVAKRLHGRLQALDEECKEGRMTDADWAAAKRALSAAAAEAEQLAQQALANSQRSAGAASALAKVAKLVESKATTEHLSAMERVERSEQADKDAEAAAVDAAPVTDKAPAPKPKRTRKRASKPADATNA